MPADDQITLPITDAHPVLHDRWSRWINCAGAMNRILRCWAWRRGLRNGRAVRALPGQSAVQTARAAVVERLINRLVTHMPVRSTRIGRTQMDRDLFGAPLSLQCGLHDLPQLLVAAQQHLTHATSSLPARAWARSPS